MPIKPNVATGYSPAGVQLVRAACLYIATKLGDFRDDAVVVGGLVPGLIIPQSSSRPLHVGTLDVDLGLAVGIFEQQRYHDLCDRLRVAGFRPDINDDGRTTSQRWRIESSDQKITVDFLIPATLTGDKGGKLRNLEDGFAAIITPGLELAFQDKRRVTLTGETLRREQASRDVWVCEAGAFTVLKALAFDSRGENKDAYDLIYTLQNYGSGVTDVFLRLEPLLSSTFTQQALAILKRDFISIDAIGPRRVAEFLGDPQDEGTCADAAGTVQSLLALCPKTS